MRETKDCQLLVFSVTLFNLDQNKNQNPSIDKVQNLKKKEGKYTNTLAKSRVTARFLMEDMLSNLLPKFTEICKETLVGRQDKYQL